MYLTEAITQRIEEFSPHAEAMPGVVIIHQVGQFNAVYMCSKGLDLLGITLKELQEMGVEYYPRFFNIEDIETFIPKISKLLHDNDPNESFSYFQQVKIKGRSEWTWYISATRLFMWDESGNPLLTLTTSIPIDRMKHIEAKAQRLIEENNFLRNNFKAFSSLSKREQLVLQKVALGLSSPEIAQELYISPETVQTHRRNIKQKLGISSVYEFTNYARAFDLI